MRALSKSCYNKIFTVKKGEVMTHNALVTLKSGLQIPEFGIGTSAFGGLFASVSESAVAGVISTSMQMSLNYFDTAPHYGMGSAEVRLGRHINHLPRSSFIVSTKVGRLIVPSEKTEDPGWENSTAAVERIFDFSAAGVERSLHESLERLQMESVEMVFIHDPDGAADQAINEVLEKLRSQGIVKTIGVGITSNEIPTRFINETDIDVVLIALRYTLLDQSAATELLPTALKKGVSVIAGGVFNSGILTSPEAGATFNYEPASPEVLARAQKIEKFFIDRGVSLTQAALQYPMQHPAISAILVGCRSAEEVITNVAHYNNKIDSQIWSEFDTFVQSF
jgi:D-threo-aldose 1-dehydrogenase